MEPKLWKQFTIELEQARKNYNHHKLMYAGGSQNGTALHQACETLRLVLRLADSAGYPCEAYKEGLKL